MALHEAAFHNSIACVQVLLDCGAPLRPRTDQGKTPLELAEEVKSEEAISLLREYKTPPAQARRVDWFYDQATFDRTAARQLIETTKNGTRNGTFVVRRSSKNPKNYALTLFNDSEFFNYEIIRLNDTTYYIDDGPFFESLEHLIDHYCRIPDGLPMTLMFSINPSGQIITSRIQSFSSTKNKGKREIEIQFCIFVLFVEVSQRLKSSLTRQVSNVDATSNQKSTQPTGLARRSTLSSSLSGSVTSLNSSSSRSRASSTQEDPLSTSSSSASLSSGSPSQQQQLTPSISEPTPATNTIPFVDRRKAVGGKIKPFVPETNTHNHEHRSSSGLERSSSSANKRLPAPPLSVPKRKSLQLRLISPNQIKQTAKLGEGEFGEVYEGFYREDLNNPTGIPVAIKILKDYSYSAKQDFLREAEHMATLNHHCICTLYGIVDSNDNSMMMVIELLLLGSMLDYLWKHKNSIGESRLKLWASQIADGMAYMERKGIVHR